MRPHTGTGWTTEGERGTYLTTTQTPPGLTKIRNRVLPLSYGLTVTGQDLHDPVLACQLLFLDPLLLDLLFFSQERFLSEVFELPLQFYVLFIVPAQLRVSVDQRADQSF